MTSNRSHIILPLLLRTEPDEVKLYTAIMLFTTLFLFLRFICRVHRFPRRNPDGSRKTSRTPTTPPRPGTGDKDKDKGSSLLLNEIDEQTTEEIAAAVTSGGGRSRAGSVYDSADLGQLEICFHVKEVWNIFEVSVQCIVSHHTI